MLPKLQPMPVPEMTSVTAYDAIVWTSFAFALITTILRLYTRLIIVRAWGLDDTLIIVAQLAAISTTGVARWHVGYVWDIRLISLEAGTLLFTQTPEARNLNNLMFRSGLISDLLYIFTLPFIKCSILAFYRRITNLKKHRYSIYALGFCIVGFTLAVILFTIFSIDPISALWNPFFVREQRIRWYQTHLQITHSSFQVFFDIVILALPIPIILKTKFRRKDRFGIIFIYLLSFVSITATVVRLVTVLRFHTKITQRDLVSERIDYSYWAILEIMTAIMCANLPALSALYRRTIGKDNNTSNASGSHANNGQTFGSKGSFSQWVYSKTASLKQHSTARQTLNDSGVVEHSNMTSETKLTGCKSATGGIAFTEIEMVSPTKGTSYSTCETAKEEEQSIDSVADVMSTTATKRPLARLNKMSNPSSPSSSSPPKPDSVVSNSIGKGPHDDRQQAIGLALESNNILQTREITIESSVT